MRASAQLLLSVFILPLVYFPPIFKGEIEEASDTYSLEGETDVHKSFQYIVVSALTEVWWECCGSWKEDSSNPAWGERGEASHRAESLRMGGSSDILMYYEEHQKSVSSFYIS